MTRRKGGRGPAIVLEMKKVFVVSVSGNEKRLYSSPKECQLEVIALYLRCDRVKVKARAGSMTSGCGGCANPFSDRFAQDGRKGERENVR